MSNSRLGKKSSIDSFKLIKDLNKHTGTFLEDKDQASFGTSTKSFNHALQIRLTLTKQKKIKEFDSKVTRFIDSLEGSPSVGQLGRFVYGFFNNNTVGSLRNIILRHAFQLNPSFFVKNVGEEGLFDNDNSHKLNDSCISNNQAFVSMNQLSMQQVSALVAIYHNAYPELNMSAKHLGSMMDLSGKVINETCQLSFNAKIFLNEILPIVKGLKVKSSVKDSEEEKLSVKRKF